MHKSVAVASVLWLAACHADPVETEAAPEDAVPEDAVPEDAVPEDAVPEITCDPGEVTIGDHCERAWTETIRFDAPHPFASQFFGHDVNVSGDGGTMVVAATGSDSTEAEPMLGLVHVYTRDGDSWIEEAQLRAANAKFADWFGTSVSVSDDGTVVVVGAPFESSAATGIGGDPNTNTAPASGAAYVFRRQDDGRWVEEAYFKPAVSDAVTYGNSVSISGDGTTLVVGAHYDRALRPEDGVTDPYTLGEDVSGAVYVYRFAEGQWSQEAFLKASNADYLDYFGMGVSTSNDGDVVAVSAFGEESDARGVNGDRWNNRSRSSGAVYVFRRTGTDWTEEAYIKASNADVFDGLSLGDHNNGVLHLSGDGATLAVGAMGEQSGATGVNGDSSENKLSFAGAVYVFRNPDGLGWYEEAYIKAPVTYTELRFGTAVTLSNAGDLLAVGAHLDASVGAGVGADPFATGPCGGEDGIPCTGAVSVFRRANDAWSMEEYIKPKSPEAWSWFGFALAASGDGRELWVSAPGTAVPGEPTQTSSGAMYHFLHRP